MKLKYLLTLAALPLLLTGCATPHQPQAFHGSDNTALVIATADTKIAEMVAPTPTGQTEYSAVLEKAQALPQHQTAVVILNNYAEANLGDIFRSRSMTLFFGLRGMGYEHIVFLQGNGTSNPEGLVTLVEYN